MTILFADLVGFTAPGERNDPEDVDAALRAYYEMARKTIERFGGVVEKYIGDAIVGLFGVPLAHEDDAERAVRAALEVVGHMSGLPPLDGERLQVRAAVNTGLALVRLQARPGSGEGVLVGDAVNTAARLLAEAPPMGVVVGEMTQRLTSRAIVYEGMAARLAKGKSKPIERWLARGPIAQPGAAIQAATTPMIGREVELGILLGLLDKAIASRSPQYALIEGEAGLGKTRLVREMRRRVDARPDFLCTWRQGRCPAYGDGLAFWALGEIVAGHAGILQSDGPEAAEDKLEKALGGGERDGWLLARLRPLVGLPAPQIDHDEAFAAWLQFILGLATARPTVLVFEDVHWANDATLAFLKHLVEHAHGVPLVVLATARPEFRESHAQIADYASLTTIKLRALTADESARMVSVLLGAAEAPGIADVAVSRGGGNPLFTEELVRFALERNVWTASPGAPSPEEVGAGVPDSLQTLISARLDALPLDQRALVYDASVVGQVFWLGALAVMDGRGEHETRRLLQTLERRELVRAVAGSSIAGENEYSFWHALIRDVASERLPRGARAEKHMAVAQWVERFSEARTNLAGIKAYHYSTALDLAQSTHDDALADQLYRPALNALSQAGDVVSRYDVISAAGYYERAVRLADDDDPQRCRLMASWGDALTRLSRYEDADSTLELAAALALEIDDTLSAARALAARATAFRFLGRRGRPLAERALALAEGLPPSPEVVDLLVHCGRELISSKSVTEEEGVAVMEQAISMAEELRLPAPPMALGLCGYLLSWMGDPRGRRMCEEAVVAAQTQGMGGILAYCQLGVAEVTLAEEGPRAAAELYPAALHSAERHGDRETARGSTAMMADCLLLSGFWDDALRLATRLADELQESHEIYDLLQVRAVVAQVRGRRGEIGPDDAAVTWLLGACRDSALGVSQPAFVVPAALYARAGAHATAAGLIEEWLAAADPPDVVGQTGFLYEAARIAVAAGAPRLAEQELRSISHDQPFVRHTIVAIKAVLAASAGDQRKAVSLYEDAALRWRGFGMPYEEAHALVGLGLSLAAIGRVDPARAALVDAARLFESLGARPDVDDVRRWSEGLPA